MQKATCRMCCAFRGGQAAVLSRINKVDTGPRALEQQQKKLRDSSTAVRRPASPPLAGYCHFLKGEVHWLLLYGEAQGSLHHSHLRELRLPVGVIYLLGGQPKERHYFLRKVKHISEGGIIILVIFYIIKILWHDKKVNCIILFDMLILMVCCNVPHHLIF